MFYVFLLFSKCVSKRFHNFLLESSFLNLTGKPVVSFVLTIECKYMYVSFYKEFRDRSMIMLADCRQMLRTLVGGAGTKCKCQQVILFNRVKST